MATDYVLNHASLHAGSASSDTYDAENMDSEEGPCSTKRRRRNPRRGAAAATAGTILRACVQKAQFYYSSFV